VLLKINSTKIEGGIMNYLATNLDKINEVGPSHPQKGAKSQGKEAPKESTQ